MLVKMLFILINLIGLSALNFLEFGVMFWPKVRKVVCHVTSHSGTNNPEKLELE